MSWRTVVISKRCKLDYKMGYMVVRGDETVRVFLDEIAILLIEKPAVSITGCLLEELVANKIRVILCDSRHNPLGELNPYYGSYDCSRKIKAQANWSESLKGAVWIEIVSEKIRKQAELLAEINKTRESGMLLSYISQIEDFDSTNREGHAAKVYFNALFGMDFTRNSENIINAALNYGYSIILSAINREISANGYLTQLGLFHDNMFNFYNLGSDLMEPFRILIDREVYYNEFEKFEKEEKHIMWNILNKNICISQTNQTLLNGIKIYVRSVFEALNEGELSAIKFYEII